MRRVHYLQGHAFHSFLPLVSLICVFLSMSIIYPFALHADDTAAIEVLTHNTEGKVFLDKDGLMHGKKHAGRRAFNVELVREIMLKLKLSPRFKDVPFKRGFRDTQKKTGIALFNVTRTPEREKTVKWVGPLQTDETYFYELKTAPTGVKSLEDAKKVKSISVLNGNVHEKTLKHLGFTNLQLGNSYAACFEMLARGRVALTPSSTLSLRERTEAAGLSPELFTRTPVLLFKDAGYIAMSLDTPDATVKAWQDALNEIRATGQYEILFNTYFLPAPKTKSKKNKQSADN